MPRPGPRRPTISVRVDADLLAWLQARAESREDGGTVSDVVRDLVRDARGIT